MWWHRQSHNTIKGGISHFFTICHHVLQKSRRHSRRSALDFSGDMLLKVRNIVFNCPGSRISTSVSYISSFSWLHYITYLMGTTDAIKFRLSCDGSNSRHNVLWWREFRFCLLYCGHLSFVIFPNTALDFYCEILTIRSRQQVFIVYPLCIGLRSLLEKHTQRFILLWQWIARDW